MIGGLAAILGGIIGAYLQAKYARRIRMDEEIAKRKVATNAEAYRRMKTIQSMLIQSSMREVQEKITGWEGWFFDARLFLPGKFPDKWLSIRNGVYKTIRLKSQLSKGDQNTADELTELEGNLSELANQAIDEIYKDMGLDRISVQIP